MWIAIFEKNIIIQVTVKCKISGFFAFTSFRVILSQKLIFFFFWYIVYPIIKARNVVEKVNTFSTFTIDSRMGRKIRLTWTPIFFFFLLVRQKRIWTIHLNIKLRTYCENSCLLGVCTVYIVHAVNVKNT